MLSVQPLHYGSSYDDAWWTGQISNTIGDRKVYVSGEESDIEWGDKDPLDVIKSTLEGVNEGAVVRSLIGRQDPALGIRAASVLVEVKVDDHEMFLVCAVQQNNIGVDAFASDSSDYPVCAELVQKFLKALPKKAPNEKPGRVPVIFWHNTERQGPRAFTKEIDCPSFNDIRENYAPATAAKFDALVGLKEPDKHGKIILWHGPPGTGKTYGVRALARAWTERLDLTVEVVLDPETLFGNVPYLYQMLLSEGSERPVKAAQRRTYRQFSRDEEAEAREKKLPLRLIILEDSTELFAEQCRGTNGFARFLNLADGLVGQGLRCVFLLTSNEQIDRIDPAIKRAGRCLQVAEFGPLRGEQMQKWLAARKTTKAAGKDGATLADLYAILEERNAVEDAPVGIGFNR